MRTERDVDADRKRLRRVVEAHGTWWLSVLRETRAWQFLLPWPLHHVQAVQGRVSRRRARQPGETRKAYTYESSGWLTLGILGWLWLCVGVHVRLESFERSYASESAKVLISGMFLLGIILSVSVAMPGQAIMNAVLKRNPRFAVEFVVPFLWALLWGVTGAALMFAFSGLKYVTPFPKVNAAVRVGATMVALYAGLMEFSVLLHTMRMYLIGLLVKAGERDEEIDGSDAPAIDETTAQQPVSDPTSATGARFEAYPLPNLGRAP